MYMQYNFYACDIQPKSVCPFLEFVDISLLKTFHFTSAFIKRIFCYNISYCIIHTVFYISYICIELVSYSNFQCFTDIQFNLHVQFAHAANEALS